MAGSLYNPQKYITMYKIYYYFNEEIDSAYDLEYESFEDACEKATYLVGIRPEFNQILVLEFMDNGNSMIREVFEIDFDDEDDDDYGFLFN